MPTLTTPKESDTRKRIDITLSNLGWHTDERKPKCNVFTERAKTNEQNKKIKGHPDYVLYESGTDNPIAIIEAKKPGKDLAKALKQGANYAKSLGVHIVFATDGNLVESRDIRSNSSLYLDEQIVSDFTTENLLLRFIADGANLHSPEKVSYTRRELISIFKKANNLLREEGIREGIDRFTEFSNLLFLKLISEIEQEREDKGEHRILEKRYCWESFCHLPSEQMLEYINGTVLKRLVNKYNHSGDVFQPQLKIKTPDILKEVIDKLSTLTLLDADSDVKGDAFEYFLKNSISVGTDLGEYFTPRHIVKLMVDLVDPCYKETVYDPCCGTGGFLIESFRHIKGKVKSNPETLEWLEQRTVYGNEITSTAKTAKMNMIIIGDGHANIHHKDSLKHPENEKYDVVLTNFPFNQKTKYAHLYGYSTEQANSSFVSHVIDALRPQGRAAVVVPDGLLFDKSSICVQLRQKLLRTCNVQAVIQLDPFVFRPYTGQPTSILVFQKGSPTEAVWFFDVVDDGYAKTGSKKGREVINKNDLPLLRQAWGDKSITQNSWFANITEIEESGFKLTANTFTKKPAKGNVKTLGEICGAPLIGGTPSKNNKNYWLEGNNIWVKIEDMKEKFITDSEFKISDEGVNSSSVKLLPSGALLFSFKLTVGKTAFTGKELYTNEAIAGLIPLDTDDKYLARYLYYILPVIDYKPYAQRATKGFTLNTNTIQDVEIPWPSYEERKKLVKECEAIEKAKEKLQKEINQTEVKKAKFLSKFVIND